MLHLDVSAGSDQLIVDPGTFIYAGDPSTRNMLRSCTSHNGPRVADATFLDPESVFSWDAQPDCSLRYALEHPEFTAVDAFFRFQSEASGESEVSRSMVFVKDRLWVLKDSLRTERPAESRWSFRTLGRPAPDASGVSIEGDTSRLHLWPISSHAATLDRRLTDTWASNDYRARVPVRGVEFVSEPSSCREVLWLAFPSAKGGAVPELVSSHADGMTMAARVRFGDETYFFAASAGGASECLGVRTDAGEILCFRSRAKSVEQVVMIHGSYVRGDHEGPVVETDASSSLGFRRQGDRYVGSVEGDRAVRGPGGLPIHASDGTVLGN